MEEDLDLDLEDAAPADDAAEESREEAGEGERGFRL